MEKQQTIQVYTKEGFFLSRCTPKRATQMVNRKKAEWLSEERVVLLYGKEHKQQVRKEVLERDGMVCYICESDLAESELTYDHITPRSQGGSDLASNMAICCKECNQDKMNMSPEQYLLYLYICIWLTLGGYALPNRNRIRRILST